MGLPRLLLRTERPYPPGMSQPDFQPTLTGPTVIVRPIAADDWTELFAAGSDPEIWKVHPRSNRYTEPEFWTYFDSAVKSRSAGLLLSASIGAARPIAK